MIDLEKIKERWAAKQLASFHHALVDIDALVAEVERLRTRQAEIADGFAFQLLAAYTELEQAIDLIKSVEWMTHTGSGGQRCVFCKEFYQDHKSDCGRQLILANDLQSCGHSRSATVISRDPSGPGTKSCGICLADELTKRGLA